MQVKTLAKRTLALLPFASKDSSRPHLQGLILSKDRMYASDGYRLVCTTIDTVESGDIPVILPKCSIPKKLLEEGFIIPVEAVSAAVKAISKKTPLPILKQAFMNFIPGKDKNSNPEMEFHSTDIDQTSSSRTRLLEGPVPDVDVVLPVDSEVAFTCYFDAKVLASTLEAVGQLGIGEGKGREGKGTPVVRIDFFKRSSSYSTAICSSVDSDGRASYGVAMSYKPIKDWEYRDEDFRTAMGKLMPEAFIQKMVNYEEAVLLKEEQAKEELAQEPVGIEK